MCRHFYSGSSWLPSNDYLSAKDSRRLIIGLFGFAATYAMLYFGDHMPYVYMHDGLLMPVYGAIVLGLAGENFLTRIFSLLPLLAVGEASYCLYILHFNLWNLIHDSKILEKTGLVVFDPWLSYLVLVIAALLTVRFIERPGQAWIKKTFAV